MYARQTPPDLRSLRKRHGKCRETQRNPRKRPGKCRETQRNPRRRRGKSLEIKKGREWIVPDLFTNGNFRRYDPHNA